MHEVHAEYIAIAGTLKETLLREGGAMTMALRALDAVRDHASAEAAEARILRARADALERTSRPSSLAVVLAGCVPLTMAVLERGSHLEKLIASDILSVLSTDYECKRNGMREVSPPTRLSEGTRLTAGDLGAIISLAGAYSQWIFQSRALAEPLLVKNRRTFAELNAACREFQKQVDAVENAALTQLHALGLRLGVIWIYFSFTGDIRKIIFDFLRSG